MKFILYLCIFLLPWTSASTQKCNGNCSNLQQNSILSNCSMPVPTHLNIQLKLRQMIISCQNPVQKNFEDVIPFDTRYLTDTSDNSYIKLSSMVQICFRSRAKKVQFALDSNFHNFISSGNLLRDYNFENLRIELTKEMQENINITLLQAGFLQYGSHLNTLQLNNLKIVDLKDYLNNISLIEELDLAFNEIEILKSETFQNLTRLRSLNLQNNRIMELNENAFRASRNLTHLDLSSNKITSLKNTTFGSNPNLVSLNLSNNKLNSINEQSFSRLTKLQELDLSFNSNLTIEFHRFSNLKSLQSLNLCGCNIEKITFLDSPLMKILNLSRNFINNLHYNSFANLTELELLDLGHNKISDLPKELFQDLKNLRHILMTNNSLKVFNLETFSYVPNLNIIDLSYNLISDFRNPTKGLRATNIILHHNKIRKFPEFLIYVEDLNLLNLNFNEIDSVKLTKNVSLEHTTVEVYLSRNQIKNFAWLNNFRNTQTSNSTWKIMFDLSENFVKCNCLRYELEQINQIGTENVVFEINSKTDICYTRYPHDNCPMIYIKNCPPMCHCYYVRVQNSIISNCSHRHLVEFPKINGLETDRYKTNKTIVQLDGNFLANDATQYRLKDYNNVTELDLSSSHIKKLEWIPNNIAVLNLDNNSLTTLQPKIIENLQRNPALRRISLNGNPWKCDCNAVAFKNFVIENKNNRITSDVKCSGSEDLLIYANICQYQNLLKIALPIGVAVFVAIVAIITALYFKYNTSIKVYLYSKNLCLWLVAEEELDKDKTYDIFISYSHKDEHFVQEQLIPELENGVTPFKICIHYRDWVPGEFISTQIVSSVLDSRRTLVILSDNFMESVWGKMEFRTAHMQAINEGRARLIVILYGELNEETLGEEMTTYLKTNTYVKWGDPWFWSKLKYALPHSKVKIKGSRSAS
ncbi:hypothetical protein ABEB36_008739 [Hypothenemus hampei]|uniref:TIR domain-containing protein n=1 Tax=Hypothenemus hampei TaxID=57062 RepID=A0ABD1EMX8_HYPHA